MPGRSASRRRHKRLARLQASELTTRRAESARLLVAWRVEASRRAGSTGASAIWALSHDPDIRSIAAALDPEGELQADLDRVCAEAVAREVGASLVRGSRPLADRARLEKAKPA